MIVRAAKFTCVTGLLLCAACAFTIVPSVCGQERVTDGSVTAAQIAQTVQHLRSSQADDRLLVQAIEMGDVLLRERRFAEAAELFGVLVQQQPSDPAVLYGQALATFNLGRVTEAEPIARKAADLAVSAASIPLVKGNRSPSAADALVLLSVVLAVKGDDAGALNVLVRAVGLAPDNFDARLALGRVLFGMGDDTGAARAFRAAIALMPSNGDALFYLATTLERSGDATEALITYRQLIERQPKRADGHLGLGVLLLKRGSADREEGIRELQRAVELDANLYEARVTLGRALIVEGRPTEAVEHLRHAAELAPNNPEPHYQLSLAYRRLGNKNQADAESAIVKRIHDARRGGKAATPINPN